MTTEWIAATVNWVVSASWKGTILIVLVAAVCWIVRERIPARWRYALWLVVLLRLAVPVGPASSLSLFNLLEPSPGATAVEFRRSPLTVGWDLPRMESAPVAELGWPRRELFTMAGWAGWIWLAGVILLSLRLALSSVGLHRRLRREPAGELAPAVLALLSECRRELGVRRAVLLRESDLVRSPALHGMIRPVLLLPRRLADLFTPAELRFVFLHELAHLKRFDLLVNWVISIVQIAHWFNPLVWLATLRMREERELACDELALSCLQQEERPGYGRTILKLLDRFRTPLPVPALLGILNDKHQMKRRLLMINRFRTHRSSLLFLALALALAAVSLTDARAGERKRVIRALDPAAHATMKKLDQVVSFELKDADLSTVLTEITARTGVVITQTPEIPAEVWQKRITIDADQVPLHAVLVETLAGLGLGFEISAEGLSVGKGAGSKHMMLREHPAEPGKVRQRRVIKHPGVPRAKEVDVIEIETNGTPAEAEKVIEILEGDEPALEGVNDRVFVRKILEAHEGLNDGAVRRDITLRRMENGVETRGTLRLEIRPGS